MMKYQMMLSFLILSMLSGSVSALQFSDMYPHAIGLQRFQQLNSRDNGVRIYVCQYDDDGLLQGKLLGIITIGGDTTRWNYLVLNAMKNNPEAMNELLLLAQKGYVAFWDWDKPRYLVCDAGLSADVVYATAWSAGTWEVIYKTDLRYQQDLPNQCDIAIPTIYDLGTYTIGDLPSDPLLLPVTLSCQRTASVSLTFTNASDGSSNLNFSPGLSGTTGLGPKASTAPVTITVPSGVLLDPKATVLLETHGTASPGTYRDFGLIKMTIL